MAIKLTLAYMPSVVVTARQATEAGGPVRQPYAEVNYIPQSGTKNLATGVETVVELTPTTKKCGLFFVSYKSCSSHFLLPPPSNAPSL